MSSTNRSDCRSTHISDYSCTPVKDIELFLREVRKIEPSILEGVILDPCAGGLLGVDCMSYPAAIHQFVSHDTIIDTIDLREDSLASIKRNYLGHHCTDKYNLIITNPPFNNAMGIIEKALHDVKDGGFVVMLLRLNFFGSKARFDFWQENMPKYCFVHSKRMSFTKGNTDSVEYMHCVWQKGYKTEFTQLKVI